MQVHHWDSWDPHAHGGSLNTPSLDREIVSKSSGRSAKLSLASAEWIFYVLCYTTNFTILREFWHSKTSVKIFIY